MKKFVGQVAELFTVLILAGALMYYIFRVVIGTPDQIKSIDKNVKQIAHSVDTVKTEQLFIIQRLQSLEERQLTHTQALTTISTSTEETNVQLLQLREAYNKMVRAIFTRPKQSPNNK